MQSPVERIRTAENVTRSPTTFTAAAQAPAPGRGQHSPQEYTGSHQVAITPAAAATALGHHALWLGRTSNRVRFTGARLVYSASYENSNHVKANIRGAAARFGA
jgi:hypothetical protein